LINFYEVVVIDGAPRLAQFRRITLPMLRPSIFLCFIIGMLNSFTSFDLVWIMTGGGPGHATELLVTWIYKQAFQQSQFDYAAAVTTALFVLLVAIAWLANRLSGGEAGAVKTG
jgi:ABC-type sugar transport system permease subunit